MTGAAQISTAGNRLLATTVQQQGIGQSNRLDNSDISHPFVAQLVPGCLTIVTVH